MIVHKLPPPDPPPASFQIELSAEEADLLVYAGNQVIGPNWLEYRNDCAQLGWLSIEGECGRMERIRDFLRSLAGKLIGAATCSTK